MNITHPATSANKNITEINRGKTQSHIEAFAQDVLTGFSQKEKHLSSKYFYDEAGSKIFSKIMELPEYYLSRCENEILTTNKQAIAELLAGSAVHVVDLGAGDGRKTKILLEQFTKQKLDFKYFPIDISKDALEWLLDSLKSEIPGLAAHGVLAEYFDALDWLKGNGHARKFVMFLGSNIGNFSLDDARRFLQSLWHLLEADDLLFIGFDLKKDPRIIRDAYDDAIGLTAEFNYNLLRRINSELGGDFVVENFTHYAAYDPVSGAVKSFLVSTQEQTVHIERLHKTFSFAQWETIHTENSCKYSPADIAQLADDCGFGIAANFFDAHHNFVDTVWKVKK
jgi:dimethylhistidine N-methyltransferase